MRTLGLALALLVTLAGCSSTTSPPGLLPEVRHDTIGHVFVIVLENEDYAATFANPPPSPYLATNLTQMGRLLSQYYGIGHASLGNYIAMVSGQAPNAETQADCPYFTDFVGSLAPDGQAIGQGCVYPAAVKTLADQLEAAGRTWRLYAQDMANGTRQPATCRHPAVGAQENSGGGQSERDQYATRHNPFVYFHSIIDDQARCDAHLVDLSLLQGDLARVGTTPELAFIVPDVCSDGHDARCANPRQRGEYDGIDDFLRAWVPRLVASPAYQQDGLVIVTFDEAEQGSPDACCEEPTGYNTPRPGITGPGGGRTGTILLAPCLGAGTADATPHNHYSLLRTLEDLWRLPHLGYAGQAGLAPISLSPCHGA
ncbi:MAG: alkaline phosphatase family protein [Thermoplasmatota archaeon]